MNATDFLPIGESAAEITRQTGQKILPWRVARLFELQVLPEPPRVANRRVIPRTMLPDIIAAMRSRGWLPAEQPAHA